MCAVIVLELCHAESGVPGFRSGVRRTLLRASAKLLTNALRHRRCPLFAEDRADGDPKSRPKGDRPEYGVRRSEVGDRTEREWERIRDRYGVRSYRSTEGAEIM